jgi:endonuclease/exonuclease/phosphatase family metal-dependent hydrolase
LSGPLPEILTGDFAPARLRFGPPRSIRVVDWNIDRGEDLPGILEFLASAGADLLLLQEVDVNAKRTRRVNVAEQIARSLKMNYVWAREFQELAQGSPDSPAYIGQATLARWPLSKPRVLRFLHQSSFWSPRWFVPKVPPFQVRSGGRNALVTEGAGLVTYNLHLESRHGMPLHVGSDALRLAQIEEVIADTRRYPPGAPLVVCGDFNLNPANSKPAAAMREAGFKSVLGPKPEATTHLLFVRGPAVDSAFLRGPVQASSPKIHSGIRASDHFPITFTLLLG